MPPIDQLIPLLLQGTWESLYMTFASTLFCLCAGIASGHCSGGDGKGGLMPNRPLNAIFKRFGEHPPFGAHF